MLSETYGFTTFQLGVMSGLLSLVWATSQLPIGRLIDRYGSKPFMVLSEAIGIIVVAGWLFSTSFVAFAALYALFGLVAATWAPALRALLANSVPTEQLGETMGRLSAFRGLIGFPAPAMQAWHRRPALRPLRVPGPHPGQPGGRGHRPGGRRRGGGGAGRGVKRS